MAPQFRSVLGFGLCLLISFSAVRVQAAPRDAEWAKVEEALENDQPETATKLLLALEPGARADQAWGEVAKSILLRTGLAAEKEDNPVVALKALDAELEKAPAPVKPLLRAVQARWLHAYYQENRYKISERTATAQAPGDDIETWDLKRILAEVDLRFQAALADKDLLQKTPVATFEKILTKGELGDTFRPTLYDFIAHDATRFYAMEEVAVSRPQDGFELAATSPALGTTDEFLAWKPETTDATSPKLRALKIYQDLLAFHRDDKDRTAFLHCDLERIRWAGNAAGGPGKETRLDAALRVFIESNPQSPLSADARRDLARKLIEKKKFREAHTIAKAGADAFPEHPFGKLCRDIVHEIESPSLEVSQETSWTPAGSSLLVKHRNVSHVFFRAYPRPWSIKPMTIEEDPNPDDDEDTDSEVRLRKLLKDKPALSWDMPLMNENDFAPGQAEVVAPENLAPGFYWIVASGDESFTTENNRLSVGLVHVSAISLLVRESDESCELDGLVTDARTGAPLPDVEVTLAHLNAKETGVKKISTKTDADGAWRVAAKSEDSQDVLLVAQRGKDRAVTRIYLSGSDEDDEPNQQSIVLFTDRGLYRPGQTIQFKGIWCHHDETKADYATIANSPTLVRLLDSNGKEVEKLDVTTNERGSFSGSFTAPSGSVLGEFILETPHGKTTIRVEEYKRPEFSCEFLPLEKPAALGQEVTVKVLATAYTGAPIDGAKVEWRVTRQSASPYRQSMPFGPLPYSEETEIARGHGHTTIDGSYAITFPALADPAIDPSYDMVFDFNIVADITDGTGETRSLEIPLAIAPTTLRASLSSDHWLVAGKKTTIKVFTSTHGGDPWPGEGVVRIHKLKQPETCSRPSPFDNRPSPFHKSSSPSPLSSDPDDWELAEMVAESPVKTSAEEGENKGKAEVSFTLPAGLYRAVFLGKDANGREVKATHGFHVVTPGATDFAPPVPFYVGTPKDELQPGETFTIVWGSGYEEARACVEWFKDGKLLKREWSLPGRTQQAFNWKVTEDLRGGFAVLVTQMTMNTLETDSIDIEVPWTTKELNLRWEHFTSKLEPGAKETWTAIITGPDGEAAAAEMVATLYDASLDAFAWHDFPGFRGLFRWDPGISSDESFSNDTVTFQAIFSWKGHPVFHFEDPPYREYEDLVGKAGEVFSGGGAILASPSVEESFSKKSFGLGPPELPNSVANFPMTPATPAASLAVGGNPVTAGNRSGDFAITRNAIDSILNASANYVDAGAGGAAGQPKAPAPIAARKNLQETAFFYPHLTSNEKGEVRISFTMAEALTKWKFLGFAHDPKMRSGSLYGEAVTSKDLMVQPNPPRFLREGDVLDFTVKITNRSEKAQSGTARFTLTDAATLADATARLGITTPEQTFEVPARESRTLSWRLTVPDGAGFLQYKAVASTETLSDGEEAWLPVIPRRVLVTESMALPIRDAGEKKFSFDKLRTSGQSDSLQSQFLHVQAVSQPAWYAVLALPYLMEFPYECAEQTFNRYYANALARHIARSDPKVRTVFDQWKGTPALDSPLLKNQDLKGILIEETPWLREAKDQSSARRRIAQLFDDNHMGDQLEGTLKKLTAMQREDGMFPWFDGGGGNEYISLYIATGFARLRALGVETDITTAIKMLPALDQALRERYEAIQKAKRLNENNLDSWIAHHLYTRSFFLKDVVITRGDQEAFDYFKGQAIKHWASLDNRMSRAHVALALHRLGETKVPELITRSLKENAVKSEEMGMEWKDNEGEGWWWWQAPIETQAMMIEAFREIDKDTKAVEDCQVWLIKQKQAQDWKTTKATADAVYAMLLGGRNLLGSDALIEISLGSLTIKPEKVEAGTVMFEARFTGPEVKPEFGDITVRKTDQGVSWASVHWQYLEDMAKLTSHNTTPLTLEKNLFVKKNTPSGPELVAVNGPVKVGDELVTRLVLRNNRAMEFIHIKDYRGSGCEPVGVLSGYRWQDGFGYYEVTRDTASHFFVDSLPPGTHVFESSVRVQHAGHYQTGHAEIRCMYAPEFNAHSGSVKLEVSL